VKAARFFAAMAMVLIALPATAQTPARTDSAKAPAAKKLLPMEPASMLEFTVREGTWISVVSRFMSSLLLLTGALAAQRSAGRKIQKRMSAWSRMQRRREDNCGLC
jgi:hypothetical protein